MFRPSIRDSIDLLKLSIVHLYQSINQPFISPGIGIVAEAGQAWLVVLKGTDGLLSIKVGIYFPNSKKRVVYEIDAFEASRIQERLNLAESFLSEMGFLMENVHYSAAKADERVALERAVPFFYASLSEFVAQIPDAKILEALEPESIEPVCEDAVSVPPPHQMVAHVESTSRDKQAGLRIQSMDDYVRLQGML